MTCDVKVSIDKYDGSGAAWSTHVDVVVTARRPKGLVGSTEEKWAELVGIAVGENVGRALKAKVQ